jgi:predicted TIM-barrel fold metal-dependent hydrolase
MVTRQSRAVEGGVCSAVSFSQRKPSEYLQTGNIYVSVGGDEPGVPKTVELVSEDCVMASADIPHAEARDSHLEEIKERHDLSERVRAKILGENPARFYGLKV